MSKVCVVCVCDCVCLHSVLSDSLWLHGLHPARLLCPYNFTGKNTGVGCHFLLQEIFPTSPVRKEMYPQYRDWTHMYCVSFLNRQILYQLCHLEEVTEIRRGRRWFRNWPSVEEYTPTNLWLRNKQLGLTLSISPLLLMYVSRPVVSDSLLSHGL